MTLMKFFFFQNTVKKFNEELVIQIVSRYDDFLSSEVDGATNYICNDKFDSLVIHQNHIALNEV